MKFLNFKFVCLYSLFYCFTFLFFILQPAFARKSAKYNFKVATLAPDRSVWIKAYNEIADEIKTVTGGDVKFKCYPGGIQGEELTVLRKMRIGQLQGAGFTGTGLAKLCKNSLVMQLLNVFKSYEEFDYVFDQMIPKLENQCRTNGYEVLGWPHLGFVYLFSKDLVTDIPTLRSSKPWQFEDDEVGKALYRVAHVTAVPAQISDVLTGLRSGLIRTVFAPPVGMLSLQWYSHIQYCLDLKGMYTFGAFIVDAKKWAKLPVRYQKKIKSICKKHFARLTDTVRNQNDEAFSVMKSQGLKMVSPTDRGGKDFQQTSQKAADLLAGKYFPRKILDLMNASLVSFRDGQENK